MRPEPYEKKKDDEATGIPNPGSAKAIKKGCICPVLDNRHGKGAFDCNGFWITEGCPLHDKAL